MRQKLIDALCLIGIIVFVVIAAVSDIRDFDTSAQAATQRSGFKWEFELGAQKLTPTTSTALTIPLGTSHAEFYVEGGECLVRWNGSAPVDSATGSMKWPAGHFRKEENDSGKLVNFRALCADCTVWVNYFGDRRVGQ